MLNSGWNMVRKKARAPPISQGIIQQDASPIMLSNYFLWNEQFKEIKIEEEKRSDFFLKKAPSPIMLQITSSEMKVSKKFRIFTVNFYIYHLYIVLNIAQDLFYKNPPIDFKNLFWNEWFKHYFKRIPKFSRLVIHSYFRKG